MADAKTPKSTGAEQVAVADPKLEATASGAGPAAINFEAADDLGESKSGATQKLKDEASKLGTQAADRARAFAGENKERATNALDEVAKMFEGAALDVDARLGEQYGKYARSAAQGISSFAESLRGKEVDDLFNDATRAGEEKPGYRHGRGGRDRLRVARLIKSGVDAASEEPDA